MSRSDLDEIQKQLKVAIQNHQMLMAQMKNNPQDSSLQRRIHATQREISSLGEKQKGIFQLLRKSSNPPNGTPAQDHPTRNVVIKPNPLPAHRPLLPAHMPVTVTTTPASAHTTPVSAHTKLVNAHTHPVIAHTNLTLAHTIPVSAHTPLVAKSLLAHGSSKALPTKNAFSLPNTLTIPFQGNSLTGKSNIVLPANLNSLALALGPNATLTLPMSTGGSLTLPASALPPHLLKPGTRLTLPVAGRNIPLVPVRPKIHGNMNNNSPVQTSSRPSTSSPAPSSPSNQRSGSSMTSSLFHSMTLQSRTNPHAAIMEVQKPVDPAEMKQDFMASLDLVSPERMKELQSKRSERKRRTTANPNFSYGNNYLSERKYGLNNYLSAMQARRHHRQRGESPLPHSHPPSPCSANGVQGHNNLHNGQSMDVHDDYCAVCRRSGQLLMCDTCSLVYHLHCLNPPLTQIPTGTWRCPKCEVEFKKRRTSSPVSIPDNNNSPQKPLSDHKSLLRQSLTTSPYSHITMPPTIAAVAPTTPAAVPLTLASAIAPPPPTLAAAVTTLIVPKPALTVPRLSPLSPLSSPAKAASPGKGASPMTPSNTSRAATPQQRPAPSPTPTPLVARQAKSPLHNESSVSDSDTVPNDTVANESEEAPMVIDEGQSSSGDDVAAANDSVAILRAVKEEERRKLLTQHQNLQSVNAQLQQKAQQLSQSIDAQIQTKAELVQSVESTQQSIDVIHQFIEVFKS